MKLVFIHGAPASGKYTVGGQLAALTGFELYHNHRVVDEVLKLHAFGTPGFVARRDQMWRNYFGQYPGPALPGVIFTFTPENTVPPAFLDWLFAEMSRRCVRIISVALTAREAAIEGRLANAQRRQFGKLTDVSLYRQLRDGGGFVTPAISRTDLQIDTEQRTPAEAARLIANFVDPAASRR